MNKFEARYWRYHVPNSVYFDTAEEAARFLDSGEDEGSLSSEGVFDETGKNLGWCYVHGWDECEPDNWFTCPQKAAE